MTLFERIVAGEIPCNKVHENSDFLAFHDINPKAPIHVLAIPKKCARSFQEVDPSWMGGMTSFIQEVARKLGLDEAGYRVITNIGYDGGQEVPHLHFHILGGTRLAWVDLRENENQAKKSL
ncbi:histidine triad nucleotide-binding protein [Wolinella succinogenes]|uniref:HIT-FAMILY PROTEIN n=1 Tax=Wolinella succinogenes (strain ATCC 29543 / DSM 1740 / CCUG 13145 / JCM 31913 / LMG 7466 / NCTC 11488 / FDC 602W) TaxID=273121 RepID=Q7M8Z0_WOLSU|nr:histidine triad nucleotide-binding protein [Wolinella succinogenes]NLU33894.1 histidine triad nucleotide-binding protein [Wolinella succinogenes]CAE10382.1 HIT-FAMILY PROTEIN [Wolinella succinogenes]VEG80454.1 HIT-like protein HI_0961 [Wolinella succinogenes]HCZ19804.1 histidine triad nucleotide-binding protein [Helicobacter sp.]